MKKITAISFINIMLFGLFSSMQPAAGETRTDSGQSYVITMKQDLLCLKRAYPETIVGVDKDTRGKVWLILKSGKKLLYDDQRKKTEEEKLVDTDLQDLLEQPYPLQPIQKLPKTGEDPGRIRSYELLGETYGENRRVIEKNLSLVKTARSRLQFNGNNNAADSLKRAMLQLEQLSESNGGVRKNVYPISGTYGYRKIAGTNRLSPHSFGIAIDLAVNPLDYWKWANRIQGQKRLEAYPKEIVSIFENNGFIWGGKWGHFDIMHFEYRPELLIKARLLTESCSSGKWYGLEAESIPSLKKFIAEIEHIIGNN